MQFKYPEILYALLLLLIPIIVHLFQLRKFKKVPFTNVAFLKEATLQTRKSSQIKKWLILFTRVLLLASLVLAFAQPFKAKTGAFKTTKETVIYLDNSFSMQAKGNQGELLKRAIQDIISHVPEDETISLITNNKVYKNTTIKAIKNELLQLDYTSNTLTAQAAILKSKTLFSKQRNTLKNLVFISDYQDNQTFLSFPKDLFLNYHLVKLNPVNTSNIFIDSVYISEKNANNIELKVLLKNNGNPIKNLPVSLFNTENLIAKTSVTIDKETSASFSLSTNEAINGKLTIEDSSLQFDNTLFFSINRAVKINVLSINLADDSFLKRIYTKAHFNYTATTQKLLNYNLLESQNLIILNELNTVSNALITALKQFTENGGSVLIIPSNAINSISYNSFLSNYKSGFKDFISSEKRITTINYSHALYNNGVFEKQVRNFQYPKVNNYYNLTSGTSSAILRYEDGKPFLVQKDNVFLFSSALNTNNSNFKNSPLIVPTLYNIGKNSFKIPELYYTIGKNNTYEISTTLQQDNILSLSNTQVNLIPEQRNYNNKVIINTSDTPNIADTYAIKNRNKIIKNVSYNYDRTESNLTYRNLSNLNGVTTSDSISEVFNTIKSDTKVHALWKWFAIFALALLIIEMAILNYFK